MIYRYGYMKVTQMPPVHAANLVANGGNTAYRVDVIRSSDNDSTGFWPPGSLHTLGADGRI